MVLECDDPFIIDITKHSTKIDNFRLIDYKGRACMVRMLDKESYIRKYNPQFKYIIRFVKGNDKGILSIEYIAITTSEYKDGLKKHKASIKKFKAFVEKSLKSNNTFKFNNKKSTKNTKKK
jgi:hypothetical protein